MPPALAFPNHEHSPAKLLEFPPLTRIALHIALQLGAPVGHSRFWNPVAGWTVVLVPKATMHEDRGSETGKHQIRLPWQVSDMQSEAVTKAMDEGADETFRSRVLATDTRHQLAAFGGSEVVHEWREVSEAVEQTIQKIFPVRSRRLAAAMSTFVKLWRFRGANGIERNA